MMRVIGTSLLLSMSLMTSAAASAQEYEYEAANPEEDTQAYEAYEAYVGWSEPQSSPAFDPMMGMMTPSTPTFPPSPVQGSCESGESATTLECKRSDAKFLGADGLTWSAQPTCKIVESTGGPKIRGKCTVTGTSHFTMDTVLDANQSQACSNSNGYPSGPCPSFSWSEPAMGWQSGGPLWDEGMGAACDAWAQTTSCEALLGAPTISNVWPTPSLEFIGGSGFVIAALGPTNTALACCTSNCGYTREEYDAAQAAYNQDPPDWTKYNILMECSLHNFAP